MSDPPVNSRDAAGQRRRPVLHWQRNVDGVHLSPWIMPISRGTDNGLFGPGSAAWTVNGSLPTFVGGIRALLIQATHPGALAGVLDHSRFREDTLGRLNGTIQWVAMTTFGDTALASESAQAISRVHQRVQGTYHDADGIERRYSAADPHLARWVHLAFTEAFLGAHLVFGREAIPGGADGYVAEWARAGELMGAANLPQSTAELQRQLDEFAPELHSGERVTEIVNFLRRPPLPRSIRLVYPILFAAAVATLRPAERARLNLARPWWPAVTACRALLPIAALGLGRHSPSRRAAEARALRLAEGR